MRMNQSPVKQRSHFRKPIPSWKQARRKAIIEKSRGTLFEGEDAQEPKNTRISLAAAKWSGVKNCLTDVGCLIDRQKQGRPPKEWRRRRRKAGLAVLLRSCLLGWVACLLLGSSCLYISSAPLHRGAHLLVRYASRENTILFPFSHLGLVLLQFFVLITIHPSLLPFPRFIFISLIFFDLGLEWMEVRKNRSEMKQSEEAYGVLSFSMLCVLLPSVCSSCLPFSSLLFFLFFIFRSWWWPIVSVFASCVR